MIATEFFYVKGATEMQTSPVLAVWKLNGDVEMMELGINSAPLKGFIHIYQQLFCGCGISLPIR